MSTRERLHVLRSTRELRGFSNAELERLLPFFDEQLVAAGEQLALEGRLCHQFVIVASGLLEACHRGRPGVLGPGDSFGWQAMRERGVNDASVSATSAAKVLVMSHEQFRAAEGLAA